MTAKLTPDAVLEGLSLLSESQLREAIARASALLGLPAVPIPSAKSSREDYEGARLVWEVLGEVAEEFGGRLVHWNALGMLKNRGALVKLLDAAYKDIEAWFLPQTKNHLRGAIHLCCRALATWMRKRDIPFSHGGIYRNLPNLSHVIDKSFPGYREADTLRLLLK